MDWSRISPSPLYKNTHNFLHSHWTRLSTDLPLRSCSNFIIDNCFAETVSLATTILPWNSISDLCLISRCLIKLEVVPPLYERTFLHSKHCALQVWWWKYFYTGDLEGFRNDTKVSDDVSVPKTVAVVEGDGDSSGVRDSGQGTVISHHLVAITNLHYFSKLTLLISKWKIFEIFRIVQLIEMNSK